MLKAERLHGDDTTLPILAKGTTDTGRTWVYVRDDRPFGGTAPPAALFYASRDRSGDHPERHLKQFTDILQADAYAGYNRLYLPSGSLGGRTGEFLGLKAACQNGLVFPSPARRKRDLGAAAMSGDRM